ncbi:helicase [Rodentibacter haemolyticus]|uniref:Helicase n=1 Tax=Rodentibacter haemolyticus TaxID=2778911 RepID=A0ABX6UVU5_9PAST|nr:helicase [Rodentibacter haemolyticus]QPB42205.1 helicase [Rodentibacter haemolyticus]
MPFIESEYQSIPHQFAQFKVAHIDYIIDFSSDRDVIESLFPLDQRIENLLRNRKTYSVKFGVKAYYESTEPDVDLYAPPVNHQFKKADIQQLKEQLETLLYKHYLAYQPECYFFIAERPSLSRMYQKMCDNRHPLMVDFIPVTQLGDNEDCFIIKTPNYQEG